MSTTPSEAAADVLDLDAAEDEGRRAASSSALIAFITEQVEPHRREFRTAANIPSSTRLLSRALGRRQVSAQKITQGRWVFRFSQTVIGGWANGVTTLVSAHSRRILRDDTLTAAHLDLMEVPHAVGGDQDAGMRLLGYVVGQQVVSMLLLIPPYRTSQAAEQSDPSEVSITLGEAEASLETPGVVAVDVTAQVSDDIDALALSGVRAIPGLQAGGVELRVADLDSAEDAVVIKVDEAADLRPHHFPTLGPGQPVAEALAEQILLTAAL